MDVAPLTPALEAKHQALERYLEGLGQVVVAFSGGVDSTLVAKVAYDVLGARARALTARSASLMSAELTDAIDLARAIGIAHQIVDTHELARPGYVENSSNRCYHCKDELFDATLLLAQSWGGVVVDGFNADDLSDHRPGHKAAAEHGVKHPLAEVNLAKAEVRALSQLLGLPTWKKPQLACLSSRLPYGMAVTPDRLRRVEIVEMALRDAGFFDLRARLVRENEDMVRIEVGEAELDKFFIPQVRQDILKAARAAGFRFVTLDLEGFRSGRMNDGLIQLRPR